MYLLEGIPGEVYRAFFPYSVVSSSALTASTTRHYPRPDYFPQGPNIVCAEDPQWNIEKDQDQHALDLHPMGHMAGIYGLPPAKIDEQEVVKVGSCVPRLSVKCVQALAKFFCHKPDAGCKLRGGDRALFLSMLSTKESITLTAEKIPDEVYWMRCCKENLRSFDVVNHGGSWKRLYIEKYIENLIEKFRPMQSDMFDIKDLLPMLEPYLKRLEITQLLPPNVTLIPHDQEEELDDDEFSNDEDNVEDADSTAGLQNTVGESANKSQQSTSAQGYGYKSNTPPPEINMKVPANHFDFSVILPLIPNLEEMILCYKVKNCGIDFRWNMFGMTIRDADNLAMGLRICKKMRKIKIHNSKIDDDKFYAVFDGIKGLPLLETISFPNNALTEESMENIVRLMSTHNKIREIDLTNNLISCDGIHFLADYLTTHAEKSSLTKINLSLNKINLEGCKLLCKALESNGVVTELNLSSNRLNPGCCKSIADMLRSNKTLKSLDLSCNQLEDSGVKILYAEGLKHNMKIRRVDIRLTGCGRDVDLAVQEVLRKNRSRTPGENADKASSDLL